ncbi:uncharacterized protein BP01DRAFT_49003 [Aspergillus saccharolyticus JOP 1030-1]|uniref:Uncharacterized protein n=1 Tax=Aspergillus saccharolyticus JOP 1030-1 TaxID=1450539 RepID=A0A318ZN41_9EURO|nr:hypothetical protein BP01DRAFT_49003 [Aspergillus saccharolyticus JOP 1030-1]PYH45320.1 hypothetical protein BP01DRAFT_49003 [Aspergillus saccharolyticus JOP 1030-1]
MLFYLLVAWIWCTVLQAAREGDHGWSSAVGSLAVQCSAVCTALGYWSYLVFLYSSKAMHLYIRGWVHCRLRDRLPSKKKRERERYILVHSRSVHTVNHTERG